MRATAPTDAGVAVAADGPARLASRLRGKDGWGAQSGFTLIEIMVALAVFSLAVLALVRLESATVRGASILDETLVANLVARNVANEAATEARPPTLGRSAGVESNAGRGWRWVRDVRPTGNPDIVRIDVAVADARGVPVGRATVVRPPDGQP